MTTLRPFLDETYFYRGEASYLSALAAARQFASAANTEDLTEDALRKPKRQFQDLFQASERWRERAKSDLADIIGSVPKKASDDLARSMAIAAFLEELKLADAKQLAKELLAKLKTSIDNRHGLENINAAIVTHILRLDPSQSSGVIAVVLPEADEMPLELRPRLQLIQQWANDQPPLAKPLAAGCWNVPATFQNEPAAGGRLWFDAVEAICPERREAAPKAAGLAEEPAGRQGLHGRGARTEGRDLEACPADLSLRFCGGLRRGGARQGHEQSPPRPSGRLIRRYNWNPG